LDASVPRALPYPPAAPGPCGARWPRGGGVLVLIPADTPIAGLHAVLQIAFGWSGDHLHRFLVHGRGVRHRWPATSGRSPEIDSGAIT